MNMAPATLPTSTARNAPNAEPRPWAARNAANATTTSDGNGGNTFSAAAATHATA
jgi:hypothetical protein